MDKNDSFDDALANISIPSAPKIPKKDASGAASSSSISVQSIIMDNNSNNSDQHQELQRKLVAAPNPHCVLVHPKQRGNPILKSITNVPIEFREIIPDYVVGRTTCILYLSLRYHTLNSEYIYNRLKALGKQYELRILLIQVDMPEPFKALKNLTRISLLTDLTLMLAWNAEEAGKIIETYKLFEKKPPDLIMEKADSHPHQKLVTALTNIKPINKTDAVTLLQNFGSLANIINSTEDKLSLCTGLGPRKANRLWKTLNESFLNKS